MKIDKGFGYNKCGIYCIKNIKNNKCYIGSSINIYYRLRRHKSDLIRKVHANSILQNSYNKNGAEAFTVSILEECTSDIVLQREQYYINTICPEYNITKEVINNRPSPETRLKTSNTMKAKAKAGIRVNCMNYNKRKLIDLYDCNCKLLKKFDSYNDAGRYIKTIYPMFTPDSVSSIVKSKFGKYKDYFLIIPGNTCNSNIPQKSHQLLITNTVTKESYTFNTATEAGKHFGCSRTAILKALSKEKLLLKIYKIKKL
jgi:hypothetical protein